VLMALKEDDDQLFYIFKRESAEGLKVSTTVGLRRNIFFGVLGHSILAFLPEYKIEKLLDEVKPHSPYSITDKDIIRDRLKKTKKEFVYAQANETTLGVTGISSPIFNMNGEPIAAIGVIGPSILFDEEQVEKVKQLVKECGENISRKMGYKHKFGTIHQ